MAGRIAGPVLSMPEEGRTEEKASHICPALFFEENQREIEAENTTPKSGRETFSCCINKIPRISEQCHDPIGFPEEFHAETHQEINIWILSQLYPIVVAKASEFL